jgi:predicted ATPase/DNA-binding CsgD family transcriptional regulator
LQNRPRSANLPASLTSFVGREREKSSLARLLAQTRLLTLSGPGGCGKTRLALEVARAVADWQLPKAGRLDCPQSFLDGVWFVELASLADGALVAQAIATALALAGEPRRTPAQTLVDYLASRRLLLVLDNCEHLIAAVASLVEELLRACPEVTILTTSREPLWVEGERVWRVPALGLPQPPPLPSWGSLIESEAVRLFVERARAGRASFRLTEENAAAVAAICRQLDGIPLALELAAARTRVLSVQQLADRLHDRFRTVSRGSRTAVARQQTLRASVDWSYALLTPEEQALFRCLSVFPGGFSLEAAEAMGDLGIREQGPGRQAPPQARDRERAGSGLGQSSALSPQSSSDTSVLDLLERLVDKSLIQAEERSGEMRYRLLETLREYGRGRLAEAGETQAALGRHAAFYQALAEMFVPNLLGRDQELDAVLERLEDEHDSLRSALHWFAECGAEGQALRLAGALWRFWYIRGYITEARSWLARLLARPARGVPGPRAVALEGAGVLAWHAGDYAAARACAEEALVLQEEIGDQAGAAWSLNCLGLIALYERDYPQASSLLQSTLAMQRRIGDPFGVAGALLNLGAVARDRGDYQAARPLIEEALELFRAAPDRRGVAFCLHNLGLLLEAEEPDASRILQQEGLRIRLELGDPQGMLESLIGLAGLVCVGGRSTRAARLFAGLDSLRRAGDLPLPPFYQQYLTRHLGSLRAVLGESAFGAAWEEGRVMTRDEAIAQALEAMPELPEPRRREPAGAPDPDSALAGGATAGGAPATTIAANPDHLSEREVEVLRLIASGYSNRQIAADLVLSIHTVERHISNIYRKIDAHGKGSAAAYALRHGLLPRV